MKQQFVWQHPNELIRFDFFKSFELITQQFDRKNPKRGHQLQTLEDPTIYEGNSSLCEPPLVKKCHEDKASNALNAETQVADGDGDKVEKIYLYGITSGFATGFWGEARSTCSCVLQILTRGCSQIFGKMDKSALINHFKLCKLPLVSRSLLELYLLRVYKLLAESVLAQVLGACIFSVYTSFCSLLLL